MNICIHPDCDRKAVCKKCCDKHYRRLLKNGDIFNYGNRVIHKGDDRERFNKKYEIKSNGCWLWTAGTRPNNKGTLYGRFHSSEMGSIGAHRMSYLLEHGNIPEGMYVCHKCDTPLCVNPDHLFLGTHSENMLDMKNKGRSHKGAGELSNASVLSNEQAKKIKNSQLSKTKLANIYGVSQTTIGRIKRGETYADA